MKSACYDSTFFCASKLATWGKDYLAKIPPEATHLLSASTSGAVVATLILAAASEAGRELLHCHIHPKDRRSHRNRAKEFSGKIPFSRDNLCVFVDDFIDSGTTMRESIAQMSEKVKDHDGELKVLCAVMGVSYYMEENPFPFPIHFANGENTLNPTPKEE
jgi:orotate phosphoribosyltransferase-like protein